MGLGYTIVISAMLSDIQQITWSVPLKALSGSLQCLMNKAVNVTSAAVVKHRRPI